MFVPTFVKNSAIRYVGLKRKVDKKLVHASHCLQKRLKPTSLFHVRTITFQLEISVRLLYCLYGALIFLLVTSSSSSRKDRNEPGDTRVEGFGQTLQCCLYSDLVLFVCSFLVNSAFTWTSISNELIV